MARGEFDTNNHGLWQIFTHVVRLLLDIPGRKALIVVMHIVGLASERSWQYERGPDLRATANRISRCICLLSNRISIPSHRSCAAESSVPPLPDIEVHGAWLPARLGITHKPYLLLYPSSVPRALQHKYFRLPRIMCQTTISSTACCQSSPSTLSPKLDSSRFDPTRSAM